MRRYLFGKNKIWFWSAAALRLAETALTVSSAVLLNLLLDAVAAGDAGRLGRVAALCAGFALARGAAVPLRAFFSARFGENAVVRLRRDLTAGLLRKSIPEFRRENSAAYLSLLNNDVAAVREKYFENLLGAVQGIAAIALASAVLLSISWVVAVLGVGLSMLSMLVPQLFGKKLAALQARTSSALARYNARVKDLFSGFEVIRSCHVEKNILASHEKYGADAELCRRRQECAAGLMEGAADMVSTAVQFGILVFAGFLTFRGRLTVGNIVAVTQLTGLIVHPAFELVKQLGGLKTVKAIGAKMEAILRTPEPERAAGAPPELNGAIELRDLSYSYGDREVLHGVSCAFRKGGKYAVVGGSGSGKSTLLRLILRYDDRYGGQILIDGTDNRSIGAERLYGMCSVIHQNVFLFDGTLRDNIALYGGYGGAQVERAAREAGLGAVIERLPGGLDARVDESGGNLSGGERQRVAVARALVRNTPVLILDEATSSLDNETAFRIESSLLDLPGRTCLVVTHRYHRGLLRRYDAIVALRDGRIEETGTFDELMAKKGYFYSLFTVAG